MYIYTKEDALPGKSGAMQRLFSPQQLSLSPGLARVASGADVRRDDVLTVSDVDVAAHKIRTQNFGDVRPPHRFAVILLVNFFETLDWKKFLI